MTTNLTDTPREPAGSFRHEAIFYAGQAEFLVRTGSFIRAGLEANEPTLVVVSAEKIELLRDDLGSDARSVTFADMLKIGQNPARIIPAWRTFVSDHVAPGRKARGVGEPIWPTRSSDELVECERHEALLNVAFDGSPAWWLACPYDVAELPPSVIDVARKNHPFVMEGADSTPSPAFPGVAVLAEPSSVPLPEPSHPPQVLRFGRADLAQVRATVSHFAEASGLPGDRRQDLVLAISEVATNSIRHGGGAGTLRMWASDGSVICEIRDRGNLGDPLVGRARPGTHQTSGYGMWLVHQLCDVVQMRTFGEEVVVRLHMARHPRP